MYGVIALTGVISEKHIHVIAILLFLCALAFRVNYVLILDIDHPIRADALKYYSLAFNLVNNGVYSLSLTPPLQVSTFITPGYPLFLALFLKLTPSIEKFYEAVLYSQAVVSSFSCVLVLLIGCRITTFRVSVIAGVLCVLSPHMVIFSGFVLTETLYVFVSLLSIYILILAVEHDKAILFFCTGALLACAALIRPGIMLFPLAVLVVYLLSSKNFRHRQTYSFIAGFVLFICPWLLWSSFQETHDDKSPLAAQIALGGYPDLIFKSPHNRGYPYKEDPEYANMISGVKPALTTIWMRAKHEPLKYINWYLLGKPAMFHQPELIVGQGGVFVYEVNSTIYDVSKIASWTYKVMLFMHPVLVALALVACVWQLITLLLGHGSLSLFSIYIVSAFILYFTALHMVLAPLPRYSIPLYPVIYIMATATIYRAYSMIRVKT